MPTIDVAKFGAVYGNVHGSEKTNSAALAQALQAAANTGGGAVLIDDLLMLADPVKFPLVPLFPGSSGPVQYGSSLALIGNGCTSRLLWPPDMKLPGITIETPGTSAPNYPYDDLRILLANLALCQGGLRIFRGGKSVRTENLSITGVKGSGSIALDVEAYDGGYLDVNVHDCEGIGARLKSSHMVHLNLTARRCQTGLLGIDCGALTGRVYAEANRGFNVDLAGVSRCLLGIWMEAAGAPQQGRRRDCIGNTIIGQYQQDSCQSWDSDPISAATADLLGADLDSLDLAALPCIPGLLTWQGLETSYPGNLLTIADAETIIIDPAAFADHTPNRWVRMMPSAPMMRWSAGDYLIARLTIEADDPSAAWLTSQTGPMLRVSANSPNFYQNVWCQGRATTVTILQRFSDAGSLGPQIYLYPAVAGSVPPAPIRLSITGQMGILSNAIG